MSESSAFKHYFNREAAQEIADSLLTVYPAFRAQAFVDQVAADVESLELKGRVTLMATALRAYLPADYRQALAYLMAILPDPDTMQGMFTSGWLLMPISAFIEHYGLEHVAESMQAMHKLTQLHTAEFCIRPYLQRYPVESLTVLHEWVSDPSEHVRRLVSEGTRTRLPWATRLPDFIANPGPVLSLLTLLRDDPSLYVRKSVANNLNDIAKDHPKLVVETLREWAHDASDERWWLIKHALRSLVKQGDRDALAILGVQPAQIALLDIELEPELVPFDGEVQIRACLRNEEATAQRCIVDYVMHFAGAHGSRSKVFKLAQVQLQAGEQLELSKKHSFRPVTIRRYYPGAHRVELQVNGEIIGGKDFELGAPLERAAF